jgi:hypothetical protein
MDPVERYKQVLTGVETVNWIRGAGKQSRERMFADSVLNDFSGEYVSIFYVGALLNELMEIDGTVVVNDLPTLIIDEEIQSSSDFQLHPLQEMTLGEAITIVALSDEIEPGDRWSSNDNPAIRLAVAAVTKDSKVLDYLSTDPCMLVRTAVAVNDFTLGETKEKLRTDPFWHVQRRTLYGDSNAIRDFDEKRELIDLSIKQVGEREFWPIDCACVDKYEAYQDLNESLQDEEGIFVPNVPEGLSGKLRNYGDWEWSTQPFPDPKSDYLLASIEYLKTDIPDQFSINNWGHGLNSYSLNLRVAIGEIAIISQVGWYGVYNDSARCREAWDQMAREVDEMIQAKNRSFSSAFRLRDFLIIYSDFRLQRPELWMRRDSTWLQVKEVKTLRDISKYVNGK